MLAQTSELSRRELKLNDDENKLATAPVHDVRVAEPTSSNPKLTSTEGAEANADIKSVTSKNKRTVMHDEEKPSWEEVIQNTAEVSSLLEGGALGLEVLPLSPILSPSPSPSLPSSSRPLSRTLQAADGLASASQKKLSIMTSPSADLDRASAPMVQTNALQKSMFDIKTEMDEAFSVAGAMQQSRLDSLEASIDARLEAGFCSAAESIKADQNRRFGDLENMIQRLEQMLIQRTDHAI